jgi:hypothetical protein
MKAETRYALSGDVSWAGAHSARRGMAPALHLAMK